ncbi:MAG: hypothetical protein ABI557_18310, partial [Aureliella sp.]
KQILQHKLPCKMHFTERSLSIEVFAGFAVVSRFRERGRAISKMRQVVVPGPKVSKMLALSV